MIQKATCRLYCALVPLLHVNDYDPLDDAPDLVVSLSAAGNLVTTTPDGESSEKLPSPVAELEEFARIAYLALDSFDTRGAQPTQTTTPGELEEMRHVAIAGAERFFVDIERIKSRRPKRRIGAADRRLLGSLGVAW